MDTNGAEFNPGVKGRVFFNRGAPQSFKLIGRHAFDVRSTWQVWVQPVTAKEHFKASYACPQRIGTSEADLLLLAFRPDRTLA